MPHDIQSIHDANEDRAEQAAEEHQKKPSAAALRIAECMGIGERQLPHFLLACDSEILRLIDALKAAQWGSSRLLPQHCPCCDQIERRGHSTDCTIGTALAHAKGDA